MEEFHMMNLLSILIEYKVRKFIIKLITILLFCRISLKKNSLNFLISYIVFTKILLH